MDNCRHFTLTPINKSLTSKSNIDFREQWMLTKTGESNWCWDDTQYNKAKAGGYFAFFHHKNKIVIHRIMAVKPPSERLPSWASNVGQGDRNVLELSNPLKEITWEEWLQINMPSRYMGSTSHDLIDKGYIKMYNILKDLELVV